jgi:hypothetical protein
MYARLRLSDEPARRMRWIWSAGDSALTTP